MAARQYTRIIISIAVTIQASCCLAVTSNINKNGCGKPEIFHTANLCLCPNLFILTKMEVYYESVITFR